MIIVQNNLGDIGYIRRRDVEPELQEDGSLFVYWSEGALTKLTSFEILNESDLTSILIGYYGDSSGQFWRHYKDGSPIRWRDLSDEDRARIREAIRPEWAKSPGKLKSEYYKPGHHKRVEYDSAGAIIGYKYLLWDRRRKVFRSWYRGKIGDLVQMNAQWIDNSLEADLIPTEENTNGIYAAKTPDSPILEKYKDMKIGGWKMILVRILLSGEVIEKPFGFRAERADILEVLNENWKKDNQDTQDPEADPGR
jgi:hypothetical protein